MIVAFVLLAVAIAWRLLGIGHGTNFAWLHNFSPLSAIALCGAMVLPRRYAIALPLVALFISDLILNHDAGVSLISVEMLARYVVLAGIAGIGIWLQRRPQALMVIGTSAACSVVFYFLTNTASWLTEPGYSRTFEGWSQALIVGLPGYPPTLTFFRNSLVSDLLFTGLFLVCLRVGNIASLKHEPTSAEPARWA